jgi:phosphate-selective porin OprO/OprP
MKNIILSTVLVGIMLLAQSAIAKSLEDILKEKGAISEEEYKEAMKNKPVDYKPDQGFTFTTLDQLFQLRIRGQLDVRYTYTDYRDPGQTDSSEFRIRNAKIWLLGYAFSKDLTYNLRGNFAGTDSSKYLENAFLNYRFVDEAQIQFGQAKVQFGRQWITLTADLEFVDVSDATDTFRPGYDTGAMLWGKINSGMLNYNLATYGGVGQNTLRATNKAAYLARVTFNPLGDFPYSEADVSYSPKPLFSIGADYFFDTWKATYASGTTTFESNNYNLKWLTSNASVFNATEFVNISEYSIDAAFKWRGFFAQGEYFSAHADGTDTHKTLKAMGFYAQAGYFIIPRHLEVAARYSYVDPNRDKSHNLRTQIQGAISYYFYKHNLKVQADFTNIDDQVVGTAGTSGNVYRLQAQVFF